MEPFHLKESQNSKRKSIACLIYLDVHVYIYILPITCSIHKLSKVTPCKTTFYDIHLQRKRRRMFSLSNYVTSTGIDCSCIARMSHAKFNKSTHIYTKVKVHGDLRVKLSKSHERFLVAWSRARKTCLQNDGKVCLHRRSPISVRGSYQFKSKS